MSASKAQRRVEASLDLAVLWRYRPERAKCHHMRALASHPATDVVRWIA